MLVVGKFDLVLNLIRNWLLTYKTAEDKGIEEIPILRRKFDERGVLENLK